MEQCCEACARKKERSEEEKKALINRLNRLEGQIRGIRSMIERDAYCPDVLTQSSAASSALRAFERALLAEHIRTCVTGEIRAGKDDAVDELLALLRRLM